MRPLTPHELLRVYDHAGLRSPFARALDLLAAACPEEPWEELAALPLGGCHARLLELHALCFGPSLQLWAECPVCREGLDLEIEVAELLAGAPEPPAGEAPPQTLSFHGAAEGALEGLTLALRPPTCGDLTAAAGCPDREEAHRRLFAGCVVEASRDGAPVEVEEVTELLSEAAGDRLGTWLAEHDPLAEVLLDLTCPACTHCWQPLLEIADCLWREAEAAARRLLEEVHALARGYGWREADVLALPARRRRLYLEMLGR